MPKVPFFFKLYMLWAISFFEKPVNTLKNNKVFRCIKTIVAVSTFDFAWINQLFSIKINFKRNAECIKLLFVFISGRCESDSRKRVF